LHDEIEPANELTQLEMPPARITKSAPMSKNFRRRFHAGVRANGSRIRPQANGRARTLAGPAASEDVVDWPVEISTVTFPVPPVATVSPEGSKMQSA
jgi:hypothetical protein